MFYERHMVWKLLLGGIAYFKCKLKKREKNNSYTFLVTVLWRKIPKEHNPLLGLRLIVFSASGDFLLFNCCNGRSSLLFVVLFDFEFYFSAHPSTLGIL